MKVRRYLCSLCKLKWLDLGDAGRDRWCPFCFSTHIDMKESDE